MSGVARLPSALIPLPASLLFVVSLLGRAGGGGAQRCRLTACFLSPAVPFFLYVFVYESRDGPTGRTASLPQSR